MADDEVEVEEKGKKERNWKDEERELLFALDVADEYCINKANIWHHKVEIFKGTSPVTKKKSPQTSSKVGLL